MRFSLLAMHYLLWRPSRHGPSRVADPLTPRARIQPRSREPGDLERQKVMTRGHARAAHRDRSLGGRAEGRRPALMQLLGGQKTPTSVDVAKEWMIARTGNVTRHGVDRFVFTSETIGGAGVHQHRRPAGERAGSDQVLDLSRADDYVIRGSRGEDSRSARPRDRIGGQPRLLPRGESTVEYGNFL